MQDMQVYVHICKHKPHNTYKYVEQKHKFGAMTLDTHLVHVNLGYNFAGRKDII